MNQFTRAARLYLYYYTYTLHKVLLCATLFPIVVRYFIPTEGVRVKLLELTKQKGGTAKILADCIKETAEKSGIADKVTGFCADSCPTNFGSRERGGNNNIYYLLKEWEPNLTGIRCAAHIVHNALKFACDLLPIDVEHIVVKIFSQFYRSTVQVEALKVMCEETDVVYTQLLGYAKTRILALAPAIGSIIKLFEPLKEYFQTLRKCPTVIKAFFDLPFVKLWLLFVKEQVKISI